MDRFELDARLRDEIRARVFGDGFMKLVQSVRRGGKPFKVSIRPVLIGEELKYQAEMSDEAGVQVKNFDRAGIADGLEKVIEQKGARDLHVMCANGDLHVRVTRKGRVTATRSAELSRKVEVLPHDRVKKTPLSSFDSAALLAATGIADADGRVRASMRGKYDQVNEFLKVVGETVGGEDADRPFAVVDCGCGKAYLTFALYFYLVRSLGFKDVSVTGVDRRADVVESARRTAKRLDVADRVVFVERDLGSFDAKRADMVVSLHACDTATDEALAKGVEWKAKYVLSAPCCQHELQKSISATGAFAGLMRQSILRERFCDILTDAFRAMIMRILGYKTHVVEFVSEEATARNILIKCEYGVKPGQAGPVGEYLELRDYWKVVPWLEGRLSRMLGGYLERYS
ncbi:MAG: SAM-dependent methyltransferase [Kiritimatiellae bacterium]|nr:SAM-dependent methyltransferase [Kiritimatiellia bacterium]